MATNPNPARITDETWRFWEQLQALEPTSQLGGIYANKSGYHNTRAANQASWPGNYSIRDGEDLGGPADKAAAVDWTFPEAQSGNYARIDTYSSRLLASGQDLNDPRCDGLREFYGQADTDSSVEGWDFRYDRAVTSDSSHLWHIHFSIDRDKVNDRATFDAVLSVLRGETVEQWRNDMTPEEHNNLVATDGRVWHSLILGADEYPDLSQGAVRPWIVTAVKDLQTKVDAISTPAIDYAKLAAALAPLMPTAAAIAKAVNDDASKRLQA